MQLLFTGDGLKKQVTRFLGGWWIEAAIKGLLALKTAAQSSGIGSLQEFA